MSQTAKTTAAADAAGGGPSAREAARLERDGPDEVPAPTPRWRRPVRQLGDPLNGVLLIAAEPDPARRPSADDGRDRP